MSVAVSVSALYRPGRIHLWVEDPITREYLAACWSDANIAFHIAGGNQGVQSIVKDAEDQGFRHVFGFVDQDFGPSNRTEWMNPDRTFRRFVSGVHEMENYLLEADALAGCRLNTGNRTAQDIQRRMEQRAVELAWWMACRRVIKQIYREFCVDFIGHPACGAVTDIDTARNCIINDEWYRQLKGRADSLVAVGQIDTLLTAAHGAAGAELTNGNWRTTFSGKELFRHVRDYVYMTHPNPTASPTELDADVARSVAAWQVTNGRVPPEVADLRLALRQRVGL